MSQDHHDLFQRSSVFDQLNLLQSLLDSKDLGADQALALLNAIRPELETPQVNKSTAYRRYGQVMDSLHREMPEVYNQIVNAWKTKRGIVEVEETPHARLVRERLRTESSQESSDFWDEAQHEPQQPASEVHAVDHLSETKTESPIEIGEGAEETEEHGEPEEAEEEREESKEEKELEEENEKEGEEPEESAEEEKEEIEDENEKEEEQEEPEEKEEETEDEDQEEKESEKEPEETENETEESEAEEAEPEEHESEREEEAETETEGSENEGEAQEESDHMISEAAEAAAESEHVSMEIEPEAIEPEGEEEPPMEAGE